MGGRESAIGVNLLTLAPVLDRWRVATVDAARRGVPPHITLLYPWRPAPLRPSDVVEVAAALTDVPALTVTLHILCLPLPSASCSKAAGRLVALDLR